MCHIMFTVLCYIAWGSAGVFYSKQGLANYASRSEGNGTLMRHALLAHVCAILNKILNRFKKDTLQIT